MPRPVARRVEAAHALARAAAQRDGVADGGGQFGMHGRHCGAGARDAFEVGGHRRDLADARPRGGFAGVAPGRRGGDGGVAREARGELRQPAGRGLRVGGEHDHVGIAARGERFIEVRDVADHALAARVVRLQRRACDPGFDDRVAARASARIVGEPHAGAGRRTRVECGEAGVEAVVVDAHRQHDDGQRGRRTRGGLAHLACGVL